MRFKSEEQRKAVFANLGNSNIDSSKLPEVNIKSDKYEKWLVKNSMDEYIQLDYRFPNLKGVTPDEIDNFLNKGTHDEIYYDLEEDKKKIKEIEKDLPIYNRDVYGWVKLDYLMNDYCYDTDKDKLDFELLKSEIEVRKNSKNGDDEAVVLAFESVFNDKNGLNPKWKDIISKNINELDEKINSIGEKKRQVLNSIDNELPQFKEFRKEYIRHVKVYDRDEIFKDSQKLGKKLKDKLVELGDIPTSGNLHNLTGDTIFITTPRGGHEFLSIFSYANGLRKWSMPSLIEDSYWDKIGIGSKNSFEAGLRSGIKLEKKLILDDDEMDNYILKESSKFRQSNFLFNDYRIYGNDWLNSSFTDSDIKNVVFLDDIVASGQQIKDVLDKVSKVFGYSEKIPINFIPIALSARDEKFDSIKSHVESFYDNINFIEPIYANKMVDYSTFKTRFLEQSNKKDEYVSIAFPWSIPDGESDRLLTQLYGDRYERNRLRRKFGEGSK